MRKFLIRNFVLGTWIKIGKIKVHMLRAPRVLLPLIVAIALFIMGNDPTDYSLSVLDWALVVFWLVVAEFGFSFFPFSYFKLNPVKYEEFDNWEQKLDFLRAVGDLKAYNPAHGDKKYGPLTNAQKEEMSKLVKIAEEATDKTFYGLSNLIPLAVSVLAIVIWYNVI